MPQSLSARSEEASSVSNITAYPVLTNVSVMLYFWIYLIISFGKSLNSSLAELFIALTLYKFETQL
jgi:hypothetical protein